MRSNKSPVINMVDTREYLIKNGIPQLFECLLTGLMYHRPNDHLYYLQQCIETIRVSGVDSIRWDLFLQQKPTVQSSLHVEANLDDNPQYDHDLKINSSRLNIKSDSVVICIIAGPGIDRSKFPKELISHYPKFIYVDLSNLLRTRARIEQNQKQSRWYEALKMINNGELLANDIVLETLLLKLNQHIDADGFIVDGYPKTEIQYLDLKEYVGLDRLKCVILLDVSEEYSRKRLSEQILYANETYNIISNNDKQLQSIDCRLNIFKTQTLHVCKLIDNDEKLKVFDGESNPDGIVDDILEVCSDMIPVKVIEPEAHSTSNTPPISPIIPVSHRRMTCQSRPSICSIPRIVPVFPDNGRINGVYNCPIILLLGGPGSGRTEQASGLCDKFPGLTHFNVTDYLREHVLDFLSESNVKDWDLTARRVHSSDPPTNKDRIIPEYWDVQSDVIRTEFSNLAANSRAVIIEGFPCHEGQLNTFNQCIGGVDLAVLLDCEETTLTDRLHRRYTRLNRIEDEDAVALRRILFFKHCTLPVIRYYDERGKLITVPGDQDQSHVLNNLIAVLEFFLRIKEESNTNEITKNLNVITDEIIPVISQLIKNEQPQTGVAIDDDQSLETSFDDSINKENDTQLNQLSIIPESIQNPSDQNTSILDVSEDNPTTTPNGDLSKYKFVFVLGCSDEIRRLYCKHLLKQCNYNYISMKSITDPVNLNGDNIFNLNKLIEIIKEEMSRTRKAGYIIDGIPVTLAQAKEIEAFNDSLKFSKCKLIILLQDKLNNESEDNLQCHKNDIENDLLEFLESTEKLCRIPCLRNEDEIVYQLHDIFS
ncbi:hypothetical protein MN116_007340 [Schistosoma mekongi]|uniref:Adenylate kinase isoenzyme 5 n=1 Tax=Schistosoma mekongi TaxID=38744 RepID=A0AAE1Z9U2_SCHME|nr:hypothetical protein MN116_007340 [Schistosoma mekongi]